MIIKFFDRGRRHKWSILGRRFHSCAIHFDFGSNMEREKNHQMFEFIERNSRGVSDAIRRNKSMSLRNKYSVGGGGGGGSSSTTNTTLTRPLV